jgi:hypothetical protein
VAAAATAARQQEAMAAEHVKHGKFSQTSLPRGCKPAVSKWACTVKRDVKGNISRLKARLGITGYFQRFASSMGSLLAMA